MNTKRLRHVLVIGICLILLTFAACSGVTPGSNESGVTTEAVEVSECTEYTEYAESIVRLERIKASDAGAGAEETESGDEPEKLETEVSDTSGAEDNVESGEKKNSADDENDNSETGNHSGSGSASNDIGEEKSDSDSETEQTVTYTYMAVSRTMYAKQALNVRSGPCKAFDRIGALSSGQAVTVTGQCNETGWYRIEYGDGVGYCSNNYLVSTKPESKSSSSGNSTSGDSSSSGGKSSSQSSSSDSDDSTEGSGSSAGSSSSSGNSNSSGSSSSGSLTGNSDPVVTKSGIILETEGTVNDLVKAFANTELSKIPSKLGEKFVNNGWRIVITENDIATTYAAEGEYEEGSVFGITIYADKIIYIQNCLLKDYDGSIYTSALHELGHWFDVMCNDGKHYSSYEDEFDALYKDEKAAYVDAFSSEAVDSNKEFFAQCFYRYITEEKELGKACPGIKAWFDNALRVF